MRKGAAPFDNPNYTERHKDIIRAFQDLVYWNYEVRCALRGMCGHSYQRIDYHMYRVITSMKEYWMLHVHSLFDSKRSFRTGPPNLVIDYLIDEIPWPADVKIALQEQKSKMEPLARSLKKPRHKIIAHHDLKTHVRKGKTLLGSHREEDEQRFYDALLAFMNTAQTAINGSPALDWPKFAETDADEFMEILRRGGHASLDHNHNA